MTLQEACELARAIEGNSDFAVIAIGRFVMMDELSSESKRNLSWGVSIVSLRDRTNRTVAHRESDWIDFAKALAPAVAKQQPAAKPVITKAVCDEHQLELF